ncbi:hypothetical protein [Maribacter sp. 2210JD10-5]|uniref:hypothetical protein n=1 Tax=Maribacter sp. 2210JD10-5 TaxID=3386272 RepID=UPI0039BC6509
MSVLTSKNELLNPSDLDWLHIVDFSDTTGSPQGTSKKIRRSNLLSGYTGLDSRYYTKNDILDIFDGDNGFPVGITSKVENWDTAFSWGDHSTFGYELLSNKGNADGYAPLDSFSYLPFVNNHPYIRNAVSSGLLNGGELTINSSDGTTFDLTAGNAVIVDRSNPLNPIITEFNWTSQTGIAATLLGTESASFIYLDSSSNIIQKSTPPNGVDRRELVFIAQLGHSGNATEILNVAQAPTIFESPLDLTRDVLAFTGVLSKGNFISANGSNLSLNKSAGSLMGEGVNFFQDASSPNIREYPEYIAPVLRMRDRNSNGANATFLDVAQYDNNGTLSPVPASDWTNQRVYMLTNGNLVVQYGQVVYNTKNQALRFQDSEDFVPIVNVTDTARLLAIITVKGNANELNDTSDAIITNISGISGGGGSTATDLTWGTITGTLSNQTDLQTALDSKLNLTGGTVTGNLTIDGVMNVGAAFVDNSANQGLFGASNSGTGEVSYLDVNANGNLLFNDNGTPYTVYHSGNFNGSDATTLNGLDSSQFVRSDIADTKEGNLDVLSGFLTAKGNGQTHRTLLGNSSTTNNFLVGGSSVGSNNTLDTYLRIRSVADGDLVFHEDGNVWDVWHTGRGSLTISNDSSPAKLILNGDSGNVDDDGREDAQIDFLNDGGTNGYRIGVENGSSLSNMVWHHISNGTPTETARLDRFGVFTLQNTANISSSSDISLNLTRTSSGNTGIRFDAGGSSNYSRLYGAAGSGTYFRLFGNSTELAQWTTGGTLINYGEITADDFNATSDERLKEEIKPLETKEIKVDWIEYKRKGRKRFGVGAQTLEKEHPEFVRTDDKGYKSVSYIDLLVAKVAELEARLEKAGL